MYRGNDLFSKLKWAKSGVRRDVERIDRYLKDSAGAEVFGIWLPGGYPQTGFSDPGRG
jgi:hypothetical protein